MLVATGAAAHPHDLRDLPSTSSPATWSWSTPRPPSPRRSTRVGTDGTPLVLHLSSDLGAGLWVRGAPPSRRRRRPPLVGRRCPGAVRRSAAGRRTLLGALPRCARLWTAGSTWAAGPHVAGRPRPADPLRLRAPPVAARHVPERVRQRAGQRRDAERRTAVHPRRARAARRQGIGVTPLVLHTGVASLEADELPYPERFASRRRPPTG